MRSVRTTFNLRSVAPVLALACMMGACAPMATHPPIHAMPWSNPGFEPLPTLMIRTLQFANLEYGDESGEFVFNLPERTPIGVYTQVGNKLETGQPMIDAGQDAFHLTSIRARGSKAEVDLLYPGPDGTMLFVTVHLRNEMMRGWRVNDTRRWHIPEQTPEPTYPVSETEQVAAADMPEMAELE